VIQTHRDTALHGANYKPNGTTPEPTFEHHIGARSSNDRRSNPQTCDFSNTRATDPYQAYTGLMINAHPARMPRHLRISSSSRRKKATVFDPLGSNTTGVAAEHLNRMGVGGATGRLCARSEDASRTASDRMTLWLSDRLGSGNCALTTCGAQRCKGFSL
jgi:hypothetical protein